MDRFDNLYFNYHLPETKNNETDFYSMCPGCGKNIYVGQPVLIMFGIISIHDDKECLIKTVGAKRKIAEKNNYYK